MPGQFCDLPIIRQWEKHQIPQLRIRSRNFIMKWVVLGYCSWSRSKYWSVTFIKVIWGRMTSFEITNKFMLIIHEWEELQTRAWSHCLRLVKTHRLICNSTYLGQHVTSRNLDLWSNFDLKFQSHQVCTCFDAPWQEEHDDAWIKPLACLVQKIFAKKLFCQKKNAILAFLTASGPFKLAQIWLHLSERTAQELANVFPLPPT